MSASLKHLQTLLDFTDTDLNANRRGRLSKAQVELFQTQSTQELKILLLIPLIITTWILVSINFTVALPVLFVVLCLGGGMVALHRDHLKTIKDQHVRKLSGHLDKNPTGGKYSWAQYIVQIDDTELPIERYLYEEIPEGKYTIYLLDDKILCIEPYRRSTSTTKKSRSSTTKKRTTTTRKTTKAKTTSRTKAKKTSSTSTKRAKPKGSVKSRSLTRTRTTTPKTKTKAR